MLSLRSLTVAVVASLSLLSLPTVSAHMAMKYPPPRNALYETDPENAGSRAHPCLGKPGGESKASFRAGETVNVEIAGGAPHGGGQCQFSLSMDGGQNFVVLKDVFDSCPLDKNYPVQIPSGVPSGKAIFAWSWINAIGNREYYMNCADVTITGGGSGFTGPKMLVANLPGYPTLEGKNINSHFDARPKINLGGGGGGNSAPSTPPSPPSENNNNNNAGQCQCPSSSPAPPPSSGNSNGCAPGLCKSKFGYCGKGPEYCGSEVASINVASEEDEDEEEALSEEELNEMRELTPHHDDEALLNRGNALQEELAKIHSELAQVEAELNHRESFDARKAEEKKRHHHKKSKKHHH